MLAELSRFRRFGVLFLVTVFVMSLACEDAEARRGRGRGRGRKGGAAQVRAKRGKRGGARRQVARGRGRSRGRGGRGIQAAPSLVGNNGGNNIRDLEDFGPASRIAPDFFGGIGGLGNFGGFGGLGGLGGFGGVGSTGFGGVNDPGLALAAAQNGDLRLLRGFSNLATDGRGKFFEVDPAKIAAGAPLRAAVSQPLLGMNGKLVTGQDREVALDTAKQIRAFNQGEIPPPPSASSSPSSNAVASAPVRGSAGVVSLRRF